MPGHVRIPVPKIIRKHPEYGFTLDLNSLSETFGVSLEPSSTARAALGSVIIDGDPTRVETADRELRRIFTAEAQRIQRLESERSAQHQAKQELPAIAKIESIVVEGRTANQKNYLRKMDQHRVVVGRGPAGTGKTFLAVGKACQLLKTGIIKKIVITRPMRAIDGEKQPWLPGDIRAKTDPWLRPIYDALHKFIGRELTEELLETEIIEIAPLGTIRGRTFDDAFIILDEAQNTTPEEMKAMATRGGQNCWMVFNGDTTQSDLEKNAANGIDDLMDISQYIDDHHQSLFGTCEFDENDVQRGPITAMMVKAYAARDRIKAAEPLPGPMAARQP